MERSGESRIRVDSFFSAPNAKVPQSTRTTPSPPLPSKKAALHNILHLLIPFSRPHLGLTSRSNSSRLVLLVVNCAFVASSSLDGFDDPHTLIVCNFAKDNVFAVEPAGDNGGDEELGAIAVEEEVAVSIEFFKGSWGRGWNVFSSKKGGLRW